MTEDYNEKLSSKGKFGFDLFTNFLSKYSAGIFVSIGLLFSIIQLLNNRSLWLDEAMLAISIIDRNSLGLLQPLDYFQVAPVLFLQLVKITGLIFNYSEIGLRIVPFIFFNISVYLIYKITKLKFNNSFYSLVAVSLFVFNPFMLYYSAEIKQYMADVFSILLMYYIYINEKRMFIKLSITGSILLFLSSIQPLILSSLGLILLIESVIYKKYTINKIIPVFLAWFVSFVIYYFAIVHNNPHKDEMLFFWTTVGGGFPEKNILSLGYYLFFFNKLFLHFSIYGILGVALVFLSLWGIISLCLKKQFEFLILIILPITLHILLSSFNIYPFNGRLILYLVPLLILSILFGLQSILSKIKREYVLVLFPIILLYNLISYFPVESFFINKNKRDDLNKNIIEISKKKSSDDWVYVAPGAGIPVIFYEKRDHLFSDLEIIFAKWNSDEMPAMKEIPMNSFNIWCLKSGLFPNSDENNIDVLVQTNNLRIINKTSYSDQLFKIQVKREK
jgi:hypothetical protein